MDDPNITIEEYTRFEEEKPRRRGKVYNWETATYGKIWYDENIHDLRSVEIEFPAIVFDDAFPSEVTLSYEPTVSSLNDNEIDFRISFDESDDEDYTVIYGKNSFSYKIISVDDLKTDLKNYDDKVNMPSFLSPEPTDAIWRILGFGIRHIDYLYRPCCKEIDDLVYFGERRVLNSYGHSDASSTHFWSVIASLTFLGSIVLIVNASMNMSPSVQSGFLVKTGREGSLITYDDLTTLVDGGANGFTNVFPSSISFETLSATISDGVELDYLVAEHVVVVVRARQHPMSLESEELEVLEQPEQFL
ncbi:hypothetical protein Tco_1549443 [Tanacetum coccineum]